MKKVLLLICLLLTCSLAYAAEITLTYDAPIRCGETTTFTVGVDDAGITSASFCKYYLNYASLSYTEKDALTGETIAKSMMVMDCSCGNYPYKGYRESPTFDFEFCASGTYCLKFYVMYRTDENSTYQFLNKTFCITVNDASHPSVDEIADSVVERLSARYADKWELAVALHDWLVGNASYDHSLVYCNPEGVLARGKGTCESYQRAYAMLLGRAGIENARATGSGHTWNLVKLDGSWYHVDPTWDDSDDIHFYFGMTDEMMALSQGHAGYTGTDGIVCDSTDDNWYVRTGNASAWAQGYADTVQAQLDAKTESFSFDAGQIQDSTYDDKIRRMLSVAWLNRQGWTESGRPVSLALTYSPDTNMVSGTAVYQLDTLFLPQNLTVLEEQALDGTGADAIAIPASLTDESALSYLPTDIIWLCESGSAAESYARAHGINYRTTEN